MAFWLLKTEPDSFSWADLVKRGARGEPWTGVRNHQAKNFLKAMAIGDLALIYHTGDERQIVGIAKVIKDAYPDPTDEKWFAVDVVAKEALATPVTLTSIKADEALSEMLLVRNGRLSVQPVREAEWARILSL
jgi:predicted RNA-binding protein with PUA-like domain